MSKNKIKHESIATRLLNRIHLRRAISLTLHLLESLVAKRQHAIRSYQRDSSPEQYAFKDSLHYNYAKEGSNLITHSKWSKRIDELAILIPGTNIIEMGCAEGLLATKLSLSKKYVYGVDVSMPRIAEATRLKNQLINLGTISNNVDFSVLDLRAEIDSTFLGKFDTFVACRVIYHFREYKDLFSLFESISICCSRVFLLGDRKKANMYHSFGSGEVNRAPFFFYASLDGMYQLLTAYGYSLTSGFTSFGDPYVIGIK